MSPNRGTRSTAAVAEYVPPAFAQHLGTPLPDVLYRY
jgi:hypothetical protein